MNILTGGAWRKGVTGVETGVDIDGDRRIVNIAHGDEGVWMLLTFLQREYPDLFKRWLENHPSAHPALKDLPQTVTVKWAEKVWKIPSRTRTGKKHIVTVMQGRWSCTCEAFMYGNVCWAMHMVMRQEAS